jgi:EAL domain-containing protein (putative c-di-GMP-specific phosphodiesterase class I)
MYDAKSTGGGVYRFFEEGMHEAAVKRLELLGELSRPSFADEMFLEYQPIFGVDSHSLIAVEALCRWRHPRRGLVPPQDFIGLAEETGRIIEIGRIILATACAHAAEWTSRFQRRLQISVNVSARQLADPSFADDVTETLAASGLEADRLVLELTESALMTGDAVAARNLEHLRERGIRIAIDDFGTGYSSLAYLAKLAIDAIKIDRSFVDECDRAAEGMRMIETITSLGHSLGLNVVAEGIERETQLRALSAAGCDALQGFLLARPLPAEAVEQLLVGPELSWLSS